MMRDSSTAFDILSTSTASVPKKKIAIVYGSPVGAEVAGESDEFLNIQAGHFSSSPTQSKATITVVTSGGNPC